MRRQLTFNYIDNKYVICDNGQNVFSIDPKDMKFDSLKFYEGIYKKKSCNVSLECSKSIDSKGKYIFNWINSIINHITENCCEKSFEEDADTETDCFSKTIKLFDLPACAGNGTFVDDDSSNELETDNPDADFAVKISGHSMEPNIPDKSVVLVKKYNGEDCIDGKAYIIELEGDVMCKRFKKLSRGANFVSDNPDETYSKIKSNKINKCRIQGLVLGLADSH